MIPFIKNIAKAVVLLVAIGIVMANQEDRLQVIFEDEEDSYLSGKSVNVDIVTYNNLALEKTLMLGKIEGRRRRG